MTIPDFALTIPLVLIHLKEPSSAHLGCYFQQEIGLQNRHLSASAWTCYNGNVARCKRRIRASEHITHSVACKSPAHAVRRPVQTPWSVGGMQARDLKLFAVLKAAAVG